MTHPDPYEKVVAYFEFVWGTIPLREEYKVALSETFSEEEVEVAFLLPEGTSTIDDIHSISSKFGFSLNRLQAITKRLVNEGLLRTYQKDDASAYERNTMLSFLEIQMRKKEHTQLREVSARVMDAWIEGHLHLPTSTPLYRIIPVESTIPGFPATEQIELDEIITDTRTILPADFVSEMLRSETIIAVTDCICRLARKAVGKGCEHPIDVCLAFNEFALALTEAGAGRMIDSNEAIRIIQECSDMGLVTTISNVSPGGHVDFVCNCCKCSCLDLNTIRHGMTNLAAPSRYVPVLNMSECVLCEACISVCPTDALILVDDKIELEDEKCIGCGLCVNRCSTDALRMSLRSEPVEIVSSASELLARLVAEAQDANSQSDETRSVFF